MILALLGTALVVSSSGGSAISDARLAETRARLDRVSADIARAQEKESALLRAISDLDTQIADQATSESEIRDQLEAAQKKREADQAAMVELDARVSGQKRWLAERLRSLYVHGRPGWLKVLFASESYADLVRRTKYQRIVARSDAARLTSLEGDLEERKKTRADYDEDLADLTRMEADARGEAASLALERSFRAKLLSDVESDKSGYERMKKALQEAADSLTRKVGALPGVFTPSRRFEERKGALLPPITARIDRPYGPYTSRQGLLMTEQGILYDASPGSEVRAVADGKVEMAHAFSSYGLMLVIDHGDGWRSVYAHNSRLVRKEGDQVREGEVIALSGETGSLEGPCLWFAIFREGKTVDPAEWLVK